MNGGRFDFDDGGSYCGGWEEGKAHGHGVCTGPQSKGEYAGAWHYGFEVSGVYTWPSGNTYQGQWQNGKRHGLGVESRGRWIYKGEWTQGLKGRYGVRQSTTNQAKYQGTWSAGFHDGYGTEIYADQGLYQGQWLRGMRHGYGVRKSAAYGIAAKFRSKSQTNASLTSLRSGRGEGEQDNSKERVDGRGGFVLKANSAAPARRRRSLSERSLAVKRTILSGLRIQKQHSTGDIHQRVTSMTGSLRSSGSTMSCTSEDSLHRGRDFAAPEEEAIDDGAVETYCGEWKNDSRAGFGICERSDGLKYHGEWANNTKNGYGVTTFRDGTKEEGKYKNNVLVVSTRRKGVLFVRSSKIRERVEASVDAANRAASIAQQKADIAASRTSTAKERAEQATMMAAQAMEDSNVARIHAKQFDPSFKQPGTDIMRRQLLETQHTSESFDMEPSISRLHSRAHSNQPSFEQQGSFDMVEAGGAGGAPSHVTTYANHVGYATHVTPNTATPNDIHHAHVNFADQSALELQQSMQRPTLGNQMSLGNFVDQMHYNPQYNAQTPMMQTPVGTMGGPMGVPYYQQQQQQQMMQQPGLMPQHTLHPSGSIPVNTGAPPGAYQQYNANPQQLAQHQQQYATVQHHHQQNAMTHQGSAASGLGPGSSQAQPPGLQVEEATPQPDENHEREFNESHAAPLPQQSALGSLFASSQSQQSSSRFSLSDDHYDQYVMAGNPQQQAKIRRNRPSLTRQTDHVSENNPNFLNRRSTLASSRDRAPLVNAAPEASGNGGGDNMGSLPNLADLEQTGLRLRREDAARLAHHRRQEVLREEEERELLRANPLRYLFHPAFRAWLVRWKVPLLLAAANLSLLLLFYNILTYEKRKTR